MTTSPLPWQLNGTELIDACGNLVGTFKDWKDAEWALDRLQNFECDGKTAQELANELSRMDRDCADAAAECSRLKLEISKLEETNTTLVQQIEALKRENADLSLRESVAVTKNEELISEITNARAALKKALEAV